MTEILHNGDAVEYLKSMESDTVDCVVTDPPYKITSRGSGGTMGGYWKETISTSNLFEAEIPEFSSYIGEIARVCKSGAHIYIMTNHVNLLEYLTLISQQKELSFIKCLIWDKKNKISGRFYMGQFEYIIFCRKVGNTKQINNCGTSDIISVGVSKLKDADGNNYHNTEKPVRLMETLILNSTKPGEVVLDPFMGIGATCVAARANGRGYIGCEINPKYFEIANRRVESTMPNLFSY